MPNPYPQFLTCTEALVQLNRLNIALLIELLCSASHRSGRQSAGIAVSTYVQPRPTLQCSRFLPEGFMALRLRHDADIAGREFKSHNLGRNR